MIPHYPVKQISHEEEDSGGQIQASNMCCYRLGNYKGSNAAPP